MRDHVRVQEVDPYFAMISKTQRYRELLGVLARHGIGIVDEEFFKHESGDQARASP